LRELAAAAQACIPATPTELLKQIGKGGHSLGHGR
jgi:hypothetical protein